MNDNGILIISIGYCRRQLLWDCLAGLRRNNPDIAVHVVSDTPVDVPHTWADPKCRNFRSRRYKTQFHKLSPFGGITLLLDDDTIVHKPLPPLEKILGDGDVALAREPAYLTVEQICNRKGSGRKQYRSEQSLTRAMCPANQPYYNSGVFAFSRTAAAKAMLDCWHEEWLRYKSLDQLALCRAMSRHPVRVTELDGAEFNCHNDYFPYRKMNPTIFHFSRSQSRRWYYLEHHQPSKPEKTKL